MAVEEKIHALELRVQAAESKHSSLKSILFGALAFLGLGGLTGWYSLYQRTLDEAQQTRVELAIAQIENLKTAAELDVAAIKSQLKTACHVPESVDKFGRCIFYENPGRYTLNYGAAAAYCTARGARLCTMAELTDAQKKGAEWCAWGWVADTKNGASNFDTRGTIAFPMQSARSGCGQKPGIISSSNVSVLQQLAGATCCI